jgi:hypothetical protein
MSIVSRNSNSLAHLLLDMLDVVSPIQLAFVFVDQHREMAETYARRLAQRAEPSAHDCSDFHVCCSPASQTDS